MGKHKEGYAKKTNGGCFATKEYNKTGGPESPKSDKKLLLAAWLVIITDRV
jgi:hypothetical protein